MKSFFIVFFTFLLISCTAPVRHYISPPEDKDTASTSQITTKNDISFLEKTTTPSLPVTLPVSEWIGKHFIALSKQELIRATGYELYSCQPITCDSTPYMPDWELKNHRIRCENISGDTLTVVAVQPDSDEWIVSFLHSRSGRTMYGRTHRHALQEIALIDDMIRARERWLNTAIFSKRGTISSLGTTSNVSIASLRVRVFDSLIVNDIQWGTTPLPVKPLWLMVTSSSSGKKGFIPTRFSWTNTHSDQIASQYPWEEDLFENDPRSLYDWEDNTWEVINNHRVIIEMTKDQVSLSWGVPDSIKKTIAGNASEIWIYPSHECTFTNGKLASISERQHP
jgi:hypothetical protein